MPRSILNLNPKAFRSGSKGCESAGCPKVISGNKRFCWEHAKEEAIKAGVIEKPMVVLAR